MTSSMNTEEKKAVADIFYDTFIEDPIKYSSVGLIDFSEIALEKLQAGGSNPSSSKSKSVINKSRAEKIFSSLLDSEIRLTTMYKEKLIQKRNSIQTKKWKIIKIRNTDYYMMEDDTFAYKSPKKSVPDYFFDGKTWSPVADYI